MRAGIALESREIGAHFGGGLIAEVAIFFEGFVEDVLKLGREIGIEANGGNGSAFKNGIENERGGLAAERKLAGGHFIEDAAEGEEIGAGIQFPALHLFGGHIGNGAERGAGTGEQRIERGGGILRGRNCRRNFREAEVENFNVAAGGGKNVGRLDVSMDDAFGVSGVKALGNLHGEVEELFEWKRLAGDQVLEGLALEALHGDEGDVFVFADFVDGADVGMVEGGGGAGFAAEALQSDGILGERFGEKFEGHGAAEFEVFGAIDDAHATAAELFDDAVMGDGLTKK